MQQFIQYLRQISAAQFAGVALLFFLPFVEVSCGSMFTIEISGQQFATGSTINVPNNPNSPLNITPSAPGQPTANAAQKPHDIEPKASAILAWIAALAGIAVSLIAGKNFRIASAGLGGLGAIMMFWLKTQIDQDFSVQGVQQLQGILTAQLQIRLLGQRDPVPHGLRHKRLCADEAARRGRAQGLIPRLSLTARRLSDKASPRRTPVAFHIRDPETDKIVRALARKKKIGITEAVKLAAKNELERDAAKVPLAERVKKIQDRIAKYPDTGEKADKAFFDELSGN